MSRVRAVVSMRASRVRVPALRSALSLANVLVVLDAPEEELWVEVTDDGVGFDPRQSPEGVGLAAMRERSAALGGELKVSSEPGKGTRVRLRLPLPS
jgi:signal transduction histidine kinase